jgi:hypothetical protein
MEQRVPFVRVLKLSRLLETFFIASVTSILVIRAFLAATGYPQLGGHGLHIAHMLWGGLLMLIALVLLLAFIGRHLQSSAALLGGIGFGTFIDELGKFITSDNNYFFQPAIPLIYMIFVLLFLVFRELEKPPSFSERTYLANALYILAQDAPDGLSEEDKNEVLWLLRAYDARDARVHLLSETVEQLPVVPPSKAGLPDRMVHSMRNLSVRLAHSPYFARIVSSCFICVVQAGHPRLDLSHTGLLILHTTTAGSGRTPAESPRIDSVEYPDWYPATGGQACRDRADERKLKECGSADWIPGVSPGAALLLAPAAPLPHAVRPPFQHTRRNPARPGPPQCACAGRYHAAF